MQKMCTWVTLCTIQSSAYVPLWLQESLSNLGSFMILRAIRYLGPSFSSSAITQSVMYGIHLAYKQSIRDCTMSILFLTEKFMKLVSIKMWYGGPSCVLYWKNNADEACVTWWTFNSWGSIFFSFGFESLSFGFLWNSMIYSNCKE